MDGFEQFGQFAGDDQRSITKHGGHVLDCFENAVRRFVKNQRARQVTQFFQCLPALAALGGQKAVEQKMLVEQTRSG